MNKAVDKNVDEMIDINRLTMYRLPIIENVNQLLYLLNIEQDEEKYFFYSNSRKKLYFKKEIDKSNGKGTRVIEIPNSKLMIIQKAICNVMLSSFNLSKSCCGFKKGKSIVDNARPHLNCKTLIKFDIKDFFPSITLKQVVRQFRYFGYGKNVSRYLGYLCVNDDLSLPQGAPTSPMLSNLICVKLDSRIEKFCKKNDFNYTRYADDITISSKNKLSNFEVSRIKFVIETIINDEGFQINQNKYHVFYSGSKLEVTGILVNEKLNVDKKVYRELDNAYRYIYKYGLSEHLEYINFNCEVDYEAHIFGLISYLKMVNPEIASEYYIKFQNLFEYINKESNSEDLR